MFAKSTHHLLILLSLVTIFVTIVSAQQGYQSNALNTHNNYRAKHGTAALAWNSQLAQIAERCAKYYADGGRPHSCNEVKGKYGENISGGWGSNGPPSFDNEAARGVKAWYDENSGYNYDDPDRSKGVTGHFTQLVWVGSKQLGFGCASNPSSKWTRCVGVYNPPGNYQGQYKQNVRKPQ